MSDDLVDWLLMADCVEKVGFFKLRRLLFSMESKADFFNRIGRKWPLLTDSYHQLPQKPTCCL